jgi:teichuronic acid biosynthesis glycosyltransferase TuaG
MKKTLMSTNNKAMVDIILPNYNSSEFLSETINSILNQTFVNWKLIIIDDNSNEATKNILKRFNQKKNIEIIWLKKNKKAGFCRNLGMRCSKSDYIAFIDSDDIWEKEKLSKQLNFMIKHKYNFTYTNYSSFRSSETKKYNKEIKTKKIFNFDTFTKNTSIATSTMIIKRSLLGNIKFSKTKICEDYFFKCQILKKAHNAYCLEDNLMKYRVRKDSLQSNKIKNLYWIWYINKNYNKFNILKNIMSIFCISINSIKKYGIK